MGRDHDDGTVVDRSEVKQADNCEVHSRPRDELKFIPRAEFAISYLSSMRLGKKTKKPCYFPGAKYTLLTPLDTKSKLHRCSVK